MSYRSVSAPSMADLAAALNNIGVDPESLVAVVSHGKCIDALYLAGPHERLQRRGAVANPLVHELERMMSTSPAELVRHLPTDEEA